MQLIYNFFIHVLQAALWLKSMFDPKIKYWNKTRKEHFKKLENIKLNSGGRKIIWMHCASLGEFEQGIPVLRTLKKLYPECFFLLSFFSPSGYEQRKNSKDADEIIYLPLDTKYNAKRIVSTINPFLFIGVKYEYWWNLLLELQFNNIKTIYLSVFIEKEKYFLKYNFFKNILQKIDCIFTQDEDSHLFLRKYGFNNSFFTLDTRVISVLERKEKENKLFSNSVLTQVNNPIIVYGSIYESDMEVIGHLLSNTEFVHLLVPHKVDEKNISNISKFVTNEYEMWSQLISKPVQSNIVIFDALGFLFDLYRYASFAYIGGGFEKNVHNTLEPAVFGIPLAFGPKNEGFLEIKDFKNLEVGKEIKKGSDLVAFHLYCQSTVVRENFREKFKAYFSLKEKNYSGLMDQIKFLLNN